MEITIEKAQELMQEFAKKHNISNPITELGGDYDFIGINISKEIFYGFETSSKGLVPFMWGIEDETLINKFSEFIYDKTGIATDIF